MNPSNNIATIARVVNLISDEDNTSSTWPWTTPAGFCCRTIRLTCSRSRALFALFARDGQKSLPRPQPRPAAALLPGEGTGRPPCWWWRTVSTHSRRAGARGARRSVPSVLHPHGSGPSRHRNPARGLPDPNPAYRRFFDPPRGILRRTSTPSRGLRPRPLRRDSPLARRGDREGREGAPRRPLLRRRRQRRAAPLPLSRASGFGSEPGPPQGFHAGRGRRRR